MFWAPGFHENYPCWDSSKELPDFSPDPMTRSDHFLELDRKRALSQSHICWRIVQLAREGKVMNTGSPRHTGQGTDTLRAAEWIPMTAARILTGIFFCISGGTKL